MVTIIPAWLPSVDQSACRSEEPGLQMPPFAAFLNGAAVQTFRKLFSIQTVFW